MAYLAAVSSSTMPIFIRTKGEVPPLSFPTVGSLHGIQIFANKLKASLLSCYTSGAKVVWKQYCDSISLILVTSDTAANDTQTTYMLDLIFNSLVLLVGLDQLENISSLERLKKDLKCCYPLIDYIFKDEHTLLSPLTHAVDVIAIDEAPTLSKVLESFTEVAQSSFGCLTVRGRICVATASWWELSSMETSLLSFFLCSLPPASSRDIPVYLPRASNKVAHRLVIFTLFEGIELSLLCTPSPPLTELQDQLPVYWSPVSRQLQSSTHSYPRCFPLSITLEGSVLAFCLVNVKTRRCLTSFKPSLSSDNHRTALSAGYHGEMKLEKRHMYLSRFLKMVCGDILPSLNPQEEGNSLKTLPSALSARVPHVIKETYSCAKHYKAYGMAREGHNLFVLFAPSTPTFTLRRLTEDIHECLAHDKTISII